LAALDRRRAQQRDQRRWAQTQVEEQAVLRYLAAERDQDHAEREAETTHRAAAVAEEAAHQRRLEAKATADFNRALAAQQCARRQRDAHQTARADQETTTWLHTTGDPPPQTTALGPKRPPSRPLPSADDPPVATAVRRRERERADAARWADEEVAIHALACQLDDVKADHRSGARRRLAEENARLAAERDAARRGGSEGTDPDIGPEWWGRFNAGTR